MTNLDNDFRRLMERVHDGDEDAAEELVATYGESVRRAVRRALNHKLRSKFDSIDFVQSVWKSFFCAPSPTGSAPSAQCFDSPAHLTAFLVGIARKKVYAEDRKRLCSDKHDVGRERALGDGADVENHAVGRQEPLPIDVAIARERWSELLRDQPEHYRKILVLKVRGQSSSSIAAALHLDETTVRGFLNKLLLNQHG
jgi:RNA polymerase sigma-70 factor (ECF subfamily)